MLEYPVDEDPDIPEDIPDDPDDIPDEPEDIPDDEPDPLYDPDILFDEPDPLYSPDIFDAPDIPPVLPVFTVDDDIVVVDDPLAPCTQSLPCRPNPA